MIVTFSLHPADEESKQVTAIKVLMESLEKGQVLFVIYMKSIR